MSSMPPTIHLSKTDKYRLRVRKEIDRDITFPLEAPRYLKHHLSSTTKGHLRVCDTAQRDLMKPVEEYQHLGHQSNTDKDPLRGHEMCRSQLV